MVKWWIPNAGSWILSKNSWLSSVVLNTPILRCISFYWLKAISKKYDLSSKLLQNERNAIFTLLFFFSEAKSKSWNNISLKIAQCEPSIFVFYPEKKQSLAWFSKLDHVQCEILRLKDTLARVLCTQQKKSMGQSRFSLPLGVENVSVTWWKIMWKTYQIHSIATVKE